MLAPTRYEWRGVSVTLQLRIGVAVILLGCVGCEKKFGEYGKSSSDGQSVTDWVDQLNQGTDKERLAATVPLALIWREGERDDRIIPALIRSLGDQATTVRCGAAIGLRFVGEDAFPAQEKIVHLLRDEDFRARMAAVEAIPEIGVQPTDGVPLLVEMLEDVDEGVRIRAAEALGKYGPAASVATTRIAELGEATESKYARELAERALRAIRSEE